MMSNEVAELVVDLNLKSLALEKKVRELEKQLCATSTETKELREYMADLAKVLGLPNQHPGNLIGIVRERLREGVLR